MKMKKVETEGVGSNVDKKNLKKKGKKRKHEEVAEENTEETIPKLTRFSDDPIPKKAKWINKQRVLVFGARGISYRDRHLMVDMRTLMPHSRPESKMERRENLFVVNEICEMKNCNKCILFEGRMKRDLYMWLATIPTGPSAKFLLENVHTMGELKLTGNCLKGTRPLLSFDENFTKIPHLALIKELIVQIFGTPNHHPKSQPFIDHVFTFSVVDNRIWFRNFQIVTEDGALVEIGPRFVMNPIKIFDKSFRGQTLWKNPSYVTPAKFRQQIRKAARDKYMNRIQQKMAYKASKPTQTYHMKDNDDIFIGDSLEKAKEIENYVETEGKTGNEMSNKKAKRKEKKKKRNMKKPETS